MRLFLCVLAIAVVGTTQPTPRSGLDLTAFDRSVRPQDDLYRFANGGWNDHVEIPPERIYVDAFTEIGDKTEIDLREIIEGVAANHGKSGSTTRQIADLYASIMDEARLEQLGITTIEPELRKVDAIRTPKDLAAEAGYLSAASFGGPFAGVVEIDADDPATPIVRIAQGGTLLPDRDYYLSDDVRYVEIRARYEKYLAEIYTLTGRVDPRSDARAVVALETALARAQWTLVDSRDPAKTNNKFAFARLPAEMPGFDWEAWAKPQGIDRTPNVVISQPSFFKAFAAMVRTTPIETWRAWLAGRYITAVSPYVSKALGDARFEFFGRVLTGQQAPRVRWKRGVGLVNQYLGDALGRLYAERHFTPAAKLRMQTLTANVLKAFRQSVADADWMSAQTKRRVLDRLSRLSTRIGAPDEWHDYNGLVIRPDDLIGNIRRGERFESADRLERARRPASREWLMTPQTVNAYYSPAANEIVLPAAILQPPLFDADADAAANYGGIGAFIGHELVHAFDDVPEFRARTRALVDQFNAFSPIGGMHVNGELTLRENAGDLGGVSLAYKAYMLSLDGRAAPEIDGFTGEQRFFLSWARIWRSKAREEYLRQWLLSVAHAPPQYRANGAVGNLPAFYAAFHVQPGDKLYRDPAQRVSIW